MPKIKYIKKLTQKQEMFIVHRLREEWSAIEQASAKHELMERAKLIGYNMGKSLFGLALVIGVLTIAMVAPNVFAIFGKRKQERYHCVSRDLPKTLRQGSSKKYWRYQQVTKNTFKFVLTPKGKKLALRIAFQKFKLHREPVWDGKWRLVIFDIPKKYSAIRDALRRKLTMIGMCPIQKSVFVYPYDCTDEVKMLAECYDAESGIEILEARFLTDCDKKLLGIFKLKKKKLMNNNG